MAGSSAGAEGFVGAAHCCPPALHTARRAVASAQAPSHVGPALGTHAHSGDCSINRPRESPILLPGLWESDRNCPTSHMHISVFKMSIDHSTDVSWKPADVHSVGIPRNACAVELPIGAALGICVQEY